LEHDPRDPPRGPDFGWPRGARPLRRGTPPTDAFALDAA